MNSERLSWENSFQRNESAPKDQDTEMQFSHKLLRNSGNSILKTELVNNSPL